MEAAGSVRIDKFLWAVRIYKTRSMAAAACTAGKVRVNEQLVKPSRGVRIGEVIIAETGDIKKTIRVMALLEKRVGAKAVPGFVEDLTPASEYEKRREPDFTPFVFRPKGSGRPTKKQRRDIEGLEF